jgi:hypothetical protein
VSLQVLLTFISTEVEDPPLNRVELLGNSGGWQRQDGLRLLLQLTRIKAFELRMKLTEAQLGVL